MIMKKSLTLFSIILMASVALTACQTTAAPTPASAPIATEASSAAIVATPAPTDLPAEEATEVPTAAATVQTGADLAIGAVKAYFAALQSADFKTAGSYISNFSLTLDGMTRGDGVAELQALAANGAKWSNLQVKDTQTSGDKTILVHVLYQLDGIDAKTKAATTDQKDELWPVRLENGKWLYNRNNLVDYHTLDVDERTVSGITVKPRQLTRYTDHMRLTMLVQNGTNDTVVWGQTSETLAEFTFGSQKVEADKTRLIFNSLRSYPEVEIDLKGYFQTYPDSLILRQWKNLKVAPWYTFQLSE
jgi:hypothetical protein